MEKKCCSFCGRSEDEVKLLVHGPNSTLICNECVAICQQLIDNNEGNVKKELVLPTPAEIKCCLDEYVVGQDDAKRILSVAVYNHYKRVKMTESSRGKIAEKNENVEETEVEKSNILMLGPTGSGKTLLAKTLARCLNVPFVVADATTLTEAGYVGEDVENILLKLIQNADYDIERAERGIIYIDEIDKIAKKSENMSITRDVSGEGVQQGLLKIIESTIASVPPQGGRKHPQQENIQIDTTNILFICGGAFVGLDKIVRKRLEKTSIGFGSELRPVTDIDASELVENVMPKDFIDYGLIPEFVGRLPITVGLAPLTESALVKILTSPRNSLVKQYQTLLKMDNIALEFDDDALFAIAQKTLVLKTGARGLRSIMEKIMLDFMYEAPSDKSITGIRIGKDCVNGSSKPIIYRKTEASQTAVQTPIAEDMRA